LLLARQLARFAVGNRPAAEFHAMKPNERSHSMKNSATSVPIALALAAGISTATSQTLVWSDTDFIVSPTEWNTGLWPGILQSVNGQLIVTENFFGSAQTNNINATHVPGVHALPSFGALPDQQTLELRADLVSANQNDAFGAIALNWAVPGAGPGSGYMFSKDEDEIALVKFYNQGTAVAWFFSSNQPIANLNVTLVLSLTRHGSNVDITTRVLDKQNANAVVFDHTVTDTPQADPVLPNRAVGGFLGMADPPGDPWPLLGSPAYVELALTWFNSQHAPNPRAQVIFDNLEVWQYESPQLTIQKAIALSWPLSQGPRQFVLVSAPSVDGPWAPVPNLWCRTNNAQIEASILATESVQFFRLRFAP
jgi:hypothetical protein